MLRQQQSARRVQTDTSDQVEQSIVQGLEL